MKPPRILGNAPPAPRLRFDPQRNRTWKAGVARQERRQRRHGCGRLLLWIGLALGIAGRIALDSRQRPGV